MYTKKHLFVFLLVITALVQTANAQSKFDSWPELKSFHTVMSQTFRPSEDGNLEPIKLRSTEMVAKADTLKKSKIPAEFDKNEVKDAVNKLAVDSKKLHELILNNGADEDVKKALSDLHDVFHKIVGLCSKEKH